MIFQRSFLVVLPKLLTSETKLNTHQPLAILVAEVDEYLQTLSQCTKDLEVDASKIQAIKNQKFEKMVETFVDEKESKKRKFTLNSKIKDRRNSKTKTT